MSEDRPLPARHIETLRLICEGHTNAEIGVLMFVGEETIKSRVKVLLRHFDARNRWHLAALAVASGTVIVHVEVGNDESEGARERALREGGRASEDALSR